MCEGDVGGFEGNVDSVRALRNYKSITNLRITHCVRYVEFVIFKREIKILNFKHFRESTNQVQIH